MRKQRNKSVNSGIPYGIVMYFKDGIYIPVTSSTKLRHLLNDTLCIVTLKEFSKHFVPYVVYKRGGLNFRLVLVDDKYHFCNGRTYHLLDIDYVDDLPAIPLFIRSMMCFNLI